MANNLAIKCNGNCEEVHQVFEDIPKYFYNVKKAVEYQYFFKLLGTTL